MLHRRVQTALVLALVILSLLGQLLPVHAAETLTISPTRAQEENSPGVTLTLTVTGATVGLSYLYTWSVVDPSGNNKTSFSNTVATSSTFTVNKVYPTATDFGGGAAIRYVGRYAVAILRTSPSFGLAATGHFDIGLTDKVFYQRTETISIKATSYSANDNVTVSLVRGGIAAPGFPKHVLADASGNVGFTWLTTASTVTGNYTVSLNGITTAPKTPPDTQTFIVNPATVIVSQIAMPAASLQRSETAQFSFFASYPDTSLVQNGSASMRIAEPDGTLHFTTATYDPPSQRFQASYRIPLDSKAGFWGAIVEVNSLNDGYGNGGPSTSTPKGFSIQPAILTLSVNVSNGTLTSGSILIMSTVVTNPDGTIFTQGNVTTQFQLSGRQAGSQVRLGYDQSQGRWVGSYTISGNDPSGLWVIQVSASDSYGNSGQGSTSTLVSVPPQQGPLTSFWFLSVLAAIAAGALIGFLFLKRKRILRRQLHVDLTAVGLEARRVMDQDFFKSIQEQLGRKKEDSGESGNG